MFKKLLASREEGFTLIEIVIVLAIAAGIMVIVFVAVAGAQAARRDTQRKADVARVRAALELFAGNNAGDYPAAAVTGGVCGGGTATSTFCNQYLGGANFVDPNGAPYTIGADGTMGAAVAGTTIIYSRNAQCTANAVAALASSPRRYGVAIFLEQGGSTCSANR